MDSLPFESVNSHIHALIYTYIAIRIKTLILIKLLHIFSFLHESYAVTNELGL